MIHSSLGGANAAPLVGMDNGFPPGSAAAGLKCHPRGPLRVPWDTKVAGVMATLSVTRIQQNYFGL